MRQLIVAMTLVGAAAWGAPALGAAQQVTPSAAEGQTQARIVGTDTGFFVVWQAGVGRNAKVRGARIGDDGGSLDAQGLTIAAGPGGCFEPAVAFGHGVTLLVWSDLRNGAFEVYGARVDGQGAVLDPGGVLLSTEPGARMADVAATPAGFVVGWAQTVEGGQGTAARVRLLDAQGQPTAAPLQLTQARPWTSGEDFAHGALYRAACQTVRITMHGPLAYVVWTGDSGNSQAIEPTRAVVDTSTGQVLAAAARAIPPPQSRLWATAVASLPDGGTLLSWTDFRGRGVLGLPSSNALVSGTLPDAGTLVSLKEDGGAREVLWPAVSAAGLVAFVVPVAASQPPHRTQWRLALRGVGADGVSRGADVTVPEQVAWPALATNARGVSLLVTTTVNGAPGETGRLVARVVTP